MAQQRLYKFMETGFLCRFALFLLRQLLVFTADIVINETPNPAAVLKDWEQTETLRTTKEPLGSRKGVAEPMGKRKR